MTATVPTTIPTLPSRPRQGTALYRSMAAELVKLMRRRTVLITLAVVAVVTIGGTILSILSAESAGPPGSGGPGPDALLSTQSLADAGGGTAVFAQTAAFTYVFLLAVFVGAVATEFTRGTFRTMLLYQPRRGLLLLGKVSVLVGYAFGAALIGAVLSWATARMIAPSQSIDTAQWTSVDGLAAGLEDVGRLALFLVGTAIFATLVGVLARSVPIGVGVALVWSGPIENIIGDGWTQAENFFPGLLLRSVLLPGSTEVSTARALATLGTYAVVALAVTVVALRRRDVTS